MKKFILLAAIVLGGLSYQAAHAEDPQELPEVPTNCPAPSDTAAGIPQQCENTAPAIERHSQTNPKALHNRVAAILGESSKPVPADAQKGTK